MSDNLSFERVKYITQTHKDLVFGFIWKSPLLLSSSNDYYQIAPLIQHIILLFSYNIIDSLILTSNEEQTIFMTLMDHWDQSNKNTINIMYLYIEI